MANKSASLIGTLEFRNGRRNTLHVGSNHNTGEMIVWQQVSGHRSQRVTGGNIAKFAAALKTVIDSGEGKWIGDVNEAALAALPAL